MNNDDKDPLSKVLNKDTANHFRTLWLSNVLDKDDKVIIWRWIDRLVLHADKYMKIK